MDRLLEVLDAAYGKSTIAPDREVGFTLISFKHLGPEAAPGISQLQQWMASKYQLEMVVVGGGYGCTRIDMEVCASDPVLAASLVLLMMRDPDFRERAKELRFRIVILQKPYVRLDLVRETEECGGNGITSVGGVVNIDNSVNVFGNSGSNIAIGSPNSEQRLSIVRDVDAVLRDLLAAVMKDAAISKEQAVQIATDVGSLRAELEKAKPDEAVVRKNLSSLGSIASIGSFVAKITGLLSGLVM